jgi:hypothetical protein
MIVGFEELLYPIIAFNTGSLNGRFDVGINLLKVLGADRKIPQ